MSFYLDHFSLFCSRNTVSFRARLRLQGAARFLHAELSCTKKKCPYDFLGIF